jgi:hypothetical protein
MAWIIGIDEAGYGPNLGPFVMSLVACRVESLPQDDHPDLWQWLGSAVRRGGEKDDGRLLIDDSKVVHNGSRGPLRLEQGVLALWEESLPVQLAHLVGGLCPEDRAELAGEIWYTGTSPVPGHAESALVSDVRQRFRQAWNSAGILEWKVGSVVICPRRFNDLVARAGSKGAVPAHALPRLLQWVLRQTVCGERLLIFADKQGGRNSYAPQLQQALPGGWVAVREEGLACSVYDVEGLDRALRVTITPRADSAWLSVSLASMVSKYLRERLMGEFNAFWQKQLPGLKPTAGYPVDAARFFEEVRPIAQQLQIPETDLWRQR